MAKSKDQKSQDKWIGFERESHESGIVDPEKDKLADRHSIPGVGDPSIRRIRPDQGSINTPPLSEQVDQFPNDQDKGEMPNASQPAQTESKQKKNRRDRKAA